MKNIPRVYFKGHFLHKFLDYMNNRSIYLILENSFAQVICSLFNQNRYHKDDNRLELKYDH